MGLTRPVVVEDVSRLKLAGSDRTGAEDVVGSIVLEIEAPAEVSVAVLEASVVVEVDVEEIEDHELEKVGLDSGGKD